MAFSRVYILAIIAGLTTATETSATSHHTHHAHHEGKHHHHQLLRRGHFMHVLKEKGLLSKGKGDEQQHYLPGLIHINPVQIDFNKIGRSFEKRLKKDEDALRGTISGMSGWEEAAKEDLTHLAEEGEKGYLADLNTMPRQAKEAHAEMMRALEGPESSDAIRAAAIGV